MGKAGTSNIKEEEMESVSVGTVYRDIPKYQDMETPQASMHTTGRAKLQAKPKEYGGGRKLEKLLKSFRESGLSQPVGRREARLPLDQPYRSSLGIRGMTPRSTEDLIRQAMHHLGSALWSRETGSNPQS